MNLNESNPHCDCGSTKALFHTEMANRNFFLLILMDILLSQSVLSSLAFDSKCNLHPSLLLDPDVCVLGLFSFLLSAASFAATCCFVNFLHLP